MWDKSRILERGNTMRKKGFIILGIVMLVILLVIISSIIWYNLSLGRPNKDTNQDIQAVVQIKTGTSTNEILNLLKQNKVIKNKFASKIYISRALRRHFSSK